MTESGPFDLKSAPPTEIATSSPVDAREIQSGAKDIEKKNSNLNEKTVRLVVFKLAGQTNAVDVDQVEEIILAPKVSPLLKAPFFVEGVMKLRGRIVPVVNLQLAMRLPSVEGNHENSVVVMAKVRDRRIGFRVDSVSETSFRSY